MEKFINLLSSNGLFSGKDPTLEFNSIFNLIVNCIIIIVLGYMALKSVYKELVWDLKNPDTGELFLFVFLSFLIIIIGGGAILMISYVAWGIILIWLLIYLIVNRKSIFKTIIKFLTPKPKKIKVKSKEEYQENLLIESYKRKLLNI